MFRVIERKNVVESDADQDLFMQGIQVNRKLNNYQLTYFYTKSIQASNQHFNHQPKYKQRGDL